MNNAGLNIQNGGLFMSVNTKQTRTAELSKREGQALTFRRRCSFLRRSYRPKGYQILQKSQKTALFKFQFSKFGEANPFGPLYTAKNHKVLKTGLNNVVLPTLFNQSTILHKLLSLNQARNQVQQCWTILLTTTQHWTMWAAQHCSILFSTTFNNSWFFAVLVDRASGSQPCPPPPHFTW